MGGCFSEMGWGVFGSVVVCIKEEEEDCVVSEIERSGLDAVVTAIATCCWCFSDMMANG